MLRTLLGKLRPAAFRKAAETASHALDESRLVELCRCAPEEALARLAIGAGAHGLVCSPQEVGRLRSILGASPYLVTPGIRPAGGDLGDQKRVATPAQAAKDGASALVIGRPIVEASDPRAAALDILQEIANR